MKRRWQREKWSGVRREGGGSEKRGWREEEDGVEGGRRGQRFTSENDEI